MDFGFGIPTRGPTATPEGVRALAERGEALGFTWLAIPDHIVIPRGIDSRYPYSETGEFPGRAGGDCLEQLTLMAWLAACTHRARLLTSIMVVPHRGPVHTAKIIATLDVLSGGRIVIGCGAGWMAEEFVAIGAPPFEQRGRVTDEYLAAFKVLWTEDDPRFEGEHVRFAGVVFEPKPVQKPHPPLWIGGESGAAMRRVVAHGDAWYPIGSNPRFPLDTLERYRGGLGRLHARAEAAGRDPASITRCYWANWPWEQPAECHGGGARRLFTGSADDVLADTAALRDLGVRNLLLNFQRPSLDESLAAMARFAEEVMAKV